MCQIAHNQHIRRGICGCCCCSDLWGTGNVAVDDWLSGTVTRRRPRRGDGAVGGIASALITCGRVRRHNRWVGFYGRP